VASNGSVIYVNDGGATINSYRMDGSLIASHGVANLPGECNQLAYARGHLYARNGGTIYCIDPLTWTSTSVANDSGQDLLWANGWLNGSLFDTPDGQLGVMGAPSNDQFTVRLYGLSSDGLTLTTAVDYTINDGWTTDEHGTAFDGTYLYRISYVNGYKAYDLRSGTVAYDGTSWDLRSDSAGGEIGNPTLFAHNHATGQFIVGDWCSGRVRISAPTGGRLSAIDQGNRNSAGDSVASLLGSAFNDSADAVSGGSSAHTLAGAAIVANGAAATEGIWQYGQTQNGTTTWSDCPGSVS
jgi:hypothetical protein